jgi:hypothetical protein
MDRDGDLIKILIKKDRPNLSLNFEDIVMEEIQKAVEVSSTSRRFLYLSWVFFVFGLAAGIIISTVFIDRETVLYGINFADYKLFIQILCSTVIILLFEKIFKITQEMKRQE